MSSLVAICSDNTIETDHEVATLVADLQRQGCNVVGVLQEPLTQQIRACNARLRSIANEKYYEISQNLGSGSSSCNLNTEALEQAAYDISQSIGENTDLVVVNRFGKREARGGGFRCVFETALALEIPVLTIVQSQWAQSWLQYGGQSVDLIQDDRSPKGNSALSDWIRCVQLRINRPVTDNVTQAAVGRGSTTG